MKIVSAIKDSLWGSIGLLFFVALATAALSTGLVALFKEIETAFGAIILFACLIVSIGSFFIIHKHPSKHRRRETILIASNYVIVLLSALLYPAGFLWWVSLFFVLILLMITNSMMAKSASSTLLLNANTLFSIPMATTCNGLMYATHISADWGTLYLTAASAQTYSALGFILSTIALLIKRQQQTTRT